MKSLALPDLSVFNSGDIYNLLVGGNRDHVPSDPIHGADNGNADMRGSGTVLCEGVGEDAPKMVKPIRSEAVS